MNHAEGVLVTHLTDVDSLDYLAVEGFLSTSTEIIPTELIRKLVVWSLEYYFRNGRKVAPTKEAFKETWADQLEQSDVELGDDTETDSVEWAVEQLRTNYAQWRSQTFVKDFAMAVAKADPTDKVAAIQEGAHELYKLAQVLVTRKNEMDAAEGFEAALARYEALVASGDIVHGMTFGMTEIDNHTRGIHPGEIAVFAAGSGVGKTWFGGRTGWKEFKRGRRVVINTLEVDLPMTFDRLACIAARVDYEKWQTGTANEGDLLRVKLALEELKDSEHRPIVLMPEKGHRTVQSMVRKAIVLGADSLIVDQLSHVEMDPKSRAIKRNDQVAEIMRDFAVAINDGHDQLPLLLLHQINREGKKESNRTGKYTMEHLGDSSEVERSASFVFTAYQSADARAVQQATFQTLKARRVPPKDWLVHWRLGIGDLRVIRELGDEE